MTLMHEIKKLRRSRYYFWYLGGLTALLTILISQTLLWAIPWVFIAFLIVLGIVSQLIGMIFDHSKTPTRNAITAGLLAGFILWALIFW
jgi:hypothetical protein